MQNNQIKLDSGNLLKISLGMLFLSLMFGSAIKSDNYGSGNLSLLSNQKDAENIENQQVIDLTLLKPEQFSVALANLKNNDIVKARLNLNDPFSIGYFPSNKSELEFVIFSKVYLSNIPDMPFLLLAAYGDSANIAENDLGNNQVVDVLLKVRRGAVVEDQLTQPAHLRADSIKQLWAIYDNKVSKDIQFELYSDTQDGLFSKLIAEPKPTAWADLAFYLTWTLAILGLTLAGYVFSRSHFLTLRTTRVRNYGASLVEFGLIIALVALVALVGVKRTGLELNCTFTGAATVVGGSHTTFTLLIPAAGGIGAAVASLQGCCNKYTNMGFFESITPTDGYYHASCSLT